MDHFVDITPSPRVLRMLGQIDFKPWQCIAELIDNSIDSFIDQVNLGDPIASPRVTIELPTEAELQDETAKIVVKDNGSGMSSEKLQHAVRAGYSGNDPVEKMGLFGMGFNISTARLGRRTEVWSTTADSPDWMGIVIDFDQLERKSSFSTQVLSKDKTEWELDSHTHGTIVCVSKLEPDRIRPLINGFGKSKTRKKLGKIYGKVMSNLGLQIIFAGTLVVPWSHCVWDEKRSVPTKAFGLVPAKLIIDEELEPRRFCTTCWFWLNNEDETCPSCGMKDHLIIRKRKLKGWIGIQRYFHKEHYGFDLIRNGRIIEELDKSLFSYENSIGERELEYPIDAIHWGGRIVGELEIDFVRVTHQKDAFDKLDPEWKYVVELIRGTSPLRPHIAERLGLPQNTSPLARLYAGYRTATAGLNDLVPGDSSGKGLNTGIVGEYVDKFYSGDKDYQNDDKWYELVLLVENAKRGGSSGGRKAGGDPPIDIDKKEKPTSGEDSNGTDTTKHPDEPPESDKFLSRTYELTLAGSNIAVIAKVFKIKALPDNAPFYVKATGFNFEFTYNPNHLFFEECVDLPQDFFLIDLAHHLLVLSAQSPRDYPTSLIERKLREKYFQDTLLVISSSADEAINLLNELRLFLDDHLPEKAPIDLALIDENTRASIERKIFQNDLGNQQDANEAIISGKFARFIEYKFLITLISKWPELVMESNFFSTPYLSLADPLKNEALHMLINCLEDILWLSDTGRDAISRDMAWRLRFSRALASLRLAQSWRSN